MRAVTSPDERLECCMNLYACVARSMEYISERIIYLSEFHLGQEKIINLKYFLLYI